MSQNQALSGAIVAAQQASQQSAQLEMVTALLAAQVANQQHGACGCHHAQQTPAQSRRSPAQVAAIAGAVCACGAVAVAMFLAVALTAVAVGIGGLALIVAIREFRKN